LKDQQINKIIILFILETNPLTVSQEISTQDLLKMIESSCSETKAVVDNLLIIDPNQV